MKLNCTLWFLCEKQGKKCGKGRERKRKDGVEKDIAKEGR